MDRTQDLWRIVANFTDDNGQTIYPLRQEGVLDLPCPMTPFDAADQALRVLAREPRDPAPKEITVSVWGRLDNGSDLAHLCTAHARLLKRDRWGREVYVRMTPWLDEGSERSHKEIEAPEGAAIRPIGD